MKTIGCIFLLLLVAGLGAQPLLLPAPLHTTAQTLGSAPGTVRALVGTIVLQPVPGSPVSLSPALLQPDALVLTGMPALTEALVTLWPNPAQTVAWLTSPATGTIRVFDPAGRQVLQLAAQPGENAVPLAGIAPGVYAVQLSTALGQFAKTLVITP